MHVAIQVQMPFGIVVKEMAALDEFQSVLFELQIYLQKLSYLQEWTELLIVSSALTLTQIPLTHTPVIISNI